jgi:hypothetical protein
LSKWLAQNATPAKLDAIKSAKTDLSFSIIQTTTDAQKAESLFYELWFGVFVQRETVRFI